MGFELVKNATQQFRTQVLTHLPEVAEATRMSFFSSSLPGLSSSNFNSG